MERVYSQRIDWENEPSIRTPLNDINLNKMDYAIYIIDGRVVGFDATKANQSDFLASLKSVDYNTTTGVFTFTYNNGQTQTIDLNIEKIPISFSMSTQGVITMITADGTTYTADISSLIKETILVNTSIITWTMTTDASGNKNWTPTILDGSIPATKLQPNFLADCLSAKSAAQNAADESEAERYKSEGYARGTADGEPVPSTSPYYHDNAKYWAEQAQAHATALSGLSDVDIDTPANGETLIYNSTSGKWENKEAASPINVIDNLTSDSATDALSAKQGKTLKGLVDNRIDKTATTELTAEEQANLKAQGLALNTDLTKLVPTLLYKVWGEGGQPTTITLSQPYTNFDMLIVSFRTNTDFVTKLVDVEGFSILTNYLLESTVQDANLYARAAIKKTSNPTVFNLEYYQTNVNWALHPTKIIGIKFLQ